MSFEPEYTLTKIPKSTLLSSSGAQITIRSGETMHFPIQRVPVSSQDSLVSFHHQKMLLGSINSLNEVIYEETIQEVGMPIVHFLIRNGECEVEFAED